MPNLLKELARCDRELAEIDARGLELETTPAYLIAMGRFDWQHEKELIQQEIARLHVIENTQDISQLSASAYGTIEGMYR